MHSVSLVAAMNLTYKENTNKYNYYYWILSQHQNLNAYYKLLCELLTKANTKKHENFIYSCITINEKQE